MKLDVEEFEAELDMEFFLSRESIPFRVTRGSSGVQLNIKVCPACGDSRWRTYFGTETGRGNCFVCNKAFNKLTFVHEHLGGVVWRDTFDFARELLTEQGWRPKREALVAVDYDTVVLPISDALPLEDGSNLEYLEQRGFGPDIVRYFALRYCQSGWWRFRDADGDWQMQNFGNRVIIPVFDLDGKLKTFQGRDITGTSKMKYLFPKELPGTGRYLLNGQNVMATNHVVMGEGALDVAAIKMAMDEEVDLRHIVPVGSFGKHLSYGSMVGDDQLGRFNILKSRGLKTVTIMWDGERSALLAALDAGKILTGIGLKARIALLPQGKDPNEVPSEVVREAFYKADVWAPSLDIRLRLRNPYAK